MNLEKDKTELYIKSDRATETFPYFSFRNFSEKDYGLKICESRDFKDIVKTLCKLSKLPWSEIESSDRKGCGSEIISRKSLNVSIPREYENKNVLSFRYSGNAPMLCVRNDDRLDVLFVDPKFTIYDHS